MLYFFSLTTDMNRFSQNLQVPAAKDGNAYGIVSGVRVHFFFDFDYLSIPFRLQSMATLKEGDQWQMWEFDIITTT